MPLTRRVFLAGVAALGFLNSKPRPKPPTAGTYSTKYSDTY